MFARKYMLTFAVCAQKSAFSDEVLFVSRETFGPIFGKFNVLFCPMHTALE